MKKYKLVTLLGLIFASIPLITFARSGCCSHHGGVCGCGCCDGTSLSATCAPYYPSCNRAYTAPTTTIPPTTTTSTTIIPVTTTIAIPIVSTTELIQEKSKPIIRSAEMQNASTTVSNMDVIANTNNVVTTMAIIRKKASNDVKKYNIFRQL
jgi:hypothetical protein